MSLRGLPHDKPVTSQLIFVLSPTPACLVMDVTRGSRNSRGSPQLLRVTSTTDFQSEIFSLWHALIDVWKSICRVVSFLFLNSIRTTQTGSLPTCHWSFSYHLHMLRWFETPKHPRDFPFCLQRLWQATSLIHPCDKCHWTFWGSRRNGIWALPCVNIETCCNANTWCCFTLSTCCLCQFGSVLYSCPFLCFREDEQNDGQMLYFLHENLISVYLGFVYERHFVAYMEKVD